MGKLLKAARRQPTLGLLIHRRPRRQVVRHPTPLRAGFDDIAQAVEHLAQAIGALPGILWQQGQIGGNQPLVWYSTCFAGGTLTSLAHSSSDTSDGYALRVIIIPKNLGIPMIKVHNSL